MTTRSEPPPGGAPWAPGLLLLASGFAALAYQVLWQRELGLLFGNTTQATATTLAVFFCGLAAGSRTLGRRCVRWARPLRAFGWLELGVAAAALLALGLLPLYRAIFGPLYAWTGDVPALFPIVKVLLCALLLLPPSFLMGGTLPVLADLAVRRGRGFAPSGTLLYALNTFGAVLGAFAAGFVLPPWIGYRGAYALAVVVGVVVGLAALRLGARDTSGARARPEAEAVDAPASLGRAVLAWAALSGFATLALQVLWTRMCALVLQNSVYTFAAVVAVFLLGLALGGTVAHRLARAAADPRRVLRALLAFSAVVVAATPFFFRWQAPVAGQLALGTAWGGYVLAVFTLLAGVVLPAALVIGVVFPYLMRVAAPSGGAAGARMGGLLAANTVGALAGALAAGFLLPAWLGLWTSILALAALYLLFALVPARGPAGWTWNALVLVLLVGLALLGGPNAEAGRGWMARPGEGVLAVYEGSGGTVAVMERGGHLKLRFDSSYTLGGSADPRWERYQSHIPLCLHPRPRRVFYLGLGTGITAGAALDHDVERVTVTELIPEAVTAAREHFRPWLNGLFEDPRVDLVVEDGRTVLHGSPATYDVVVGDLFLPWKRGTGLLFTVEQFEAVRARLAPGGIYAQWFPLYQLSEEEFLGVARGFLEVFPRTTVWRGDFFASRPILALVGHVDEAPLDGERFVAAFRRLEERGTVAFGDALASLPFHFYAGNLAGVRSELEKRPRNTDGRPWVELAAPRSERARRAGRARAFVAGELAAFQRALHEATPPARDPYLRALTPAQRRYVAGGLHLYAWATSPVIGDGRARRDAWAGYLRSVPSAVRPRLDDWVR
jgi:spermidine synthase